MKNLFLILFLFVSVLGFAQKTPQTLGNKKTEIQVPGDLKVDSSLTIPLDTLASARNGSVAVILPDSNVYLKISGVWHSTGKKITAGYGLYFSGNTLKVDTSWNGLQTKADMTRRLDSLPKYYPTALDFTNDTLTVSINGRPDLTVEIPLSSKLSPTDTTNKWVNRITKSGDSVFYWKGSSRYFIYTVEAISDGNNYTTSVTYFDDTLNVQRDGLSDFNVPLPFSTKLNISDTADMLSTYINAPGYGLLKDGQNLVVDTATIVSKLYLSWLPSYNVSSTDINNWNTAYNKRLVGVSVTGSSTKTIQATLADGTQLSTSFIDNTGGDSSRGMNINTDTTAAQILTTGTDGNDFNIESNGLGVHAFNLPFASNTSIGKLDSSYFRKFDSVYAVIKSGVVTRARGAISLTTTGTTGASTYDNLTGVLNIPNYTNGSYSWSGATLGTSYSSTSLTIDANAVAWSFTGSSPATWTLPSYGTFTNRAIWIKNIGSATLTVQRAGTDQIYTTTSVTSIAVEPGESVCIMAAANGLSPNTWSVLFDGSGGSTNSNIGSGFRLAVPYTNNLKTLFPGYGFLMDSTTNTNGITFKLDTTTLDTRYLSSISVQDSTFDLDASSGIIKVRPYSAKKGSNPGYPYFYNDGAYTGANNFPSYYNELWLDGNLNTGLLRWSYQGTEIGRLSSSISGSNKGGNVTLRAPVSSNYFQTIVGQESLGSSTTLRLPNTGNATDTIATLHDVRVGGGSSGGSGTDSAAVLSTSVANARKTNSTIYNVLDSLTGEWVTYKKVTKWLDGNNMTDPKVDNVWFIKVGSEYFERQWSNKVVNLASYGVVANNSTNNRYIIQSVIDYLPENYSADIFLPASSSKYYVDSTITIKDKPIRLFGVNRSTTLRFPAGVTGIHVARLHGYDHEVIENLTLEGPGTYTPDSLRQFCGLIIEGITKLKNVTVKYFSGHGLKMSGSIVSSGTNVSASYIENFSASGCGGDGIRVLGDDANGITFINPDIRDCLGYGLYDGSFLGFSVYGGEFHNNSLGHVTQVNSTPVTTMFGTYFEIQPEKCYLNGIFSFIGGYAGSEMLGKRVNVSNGRSNTWVGTQNDFDESQIGFQLDTTSRKAMFIVDGSPGNGFAAYNQGGRAYDAVNMYLHYRSSNVIDTSVHIAAWHGRYQTYTGLLGYKRINRIPITSVENQLQGGYLIQYATSLSNIISSPYRVGDKVINKNWDGTNVKEWVCISPGTIFHASVTDTTTGLTGTVASGGNVIQLVGGGASPQQSIGEGDYIKINGTVCRILSKDSSYPYKITVDQTLPVISSPTNIYVGQFPQWRAVGTGVGTTSQRPTLTSNDVGWGYFNLDSNKLQVFDGSAWITQGGTGGSATATWGTITGTLSSQSDLQTALNAKQATLVSGTNIKTINGVTLLGSGDMTISASPAGSSGQLQYNNAGSLGAAAINYNNSTAEFLMGGSTDYGSYQFQFENPAYFRSQTTFYTGLGTAKITSVASFGVNSKIETNRGNGNFYNIDDNASSITWASAFNNKGILNLFNNTTVTPSSYNISLIQANGGIDLTSGGTLKGFEFNPTVTNLASGNLYSVWLNKGTAYLGGAKVQLAAPTQADSLIKYAANYGSAYDARTLVDKNYVDSAIAAGGGSTPTFDQTLAEDSVANHNIVLNSNKQIILDADGSGAGNARITGRYSGIAAVGMSSNGGTNWAEFTFPDNDRIYTFPDATGTVALLSDIDEKILEVTNFYFANPVHADSAFYLRGTDTLLSKMYIPVAASNKISIGATVKVGDSILNYPIDVVEANFTLNNIGGTLQASKGGVPTGGTTGQVLKKNSGTNYDYSWADESGGSSNHINSSNGTSLQAVKVGSANSTQADNDEAYTSYVLDNDAGTETEFGRITIVGTDINAGTSVDGALDFGVVTAGSMAKELRLTGASLTPSADGGLDLGTTTVGYGVLNLTNGGSINFDNDIQIRHSNLNEIRFENGDLYYFDDEILPTSNNTIALGTTANRWADLFLGDGAVINMDSRTITEGASGLTVNADWFVPDEAYGSGFDGDLSTPTKNAVYDKIESLNLVSGTYTPTISSATNITGQTIYDATYMRVGNTVTVSGRIAINVTASGNVNFRFSLPVATTFSALGQGEGVITSQDGTDRGVVMETAASTTTVQMNFTAAASGTKDYHYHYTYRVL